MNSKLQLDRQMREQSLQLMCFLDMHPELSAEQAYLHYYDHLLEDNEVERSHSQVHSTSLEAQQIVKQFVSGTHRSLSDIDELIKKLSHHWRIERMTWVDRNLLRIAIYELQTQLKTSPQIIINEAIELAKSFGTQNSPAFINGILDKAKSVLGR